MLGKLYIIYLDECTSAISADIENDLVGLQGRAVADQGRVDPDLLDTLSAHVPRVREGAGIRHFHRRLLHIYIHQPLLHSKCSMLQLSEIEPNGRRHSRSLVRILFDDRADFVHGLDQIISAIQIILLLLVL